MDYFHQVQTFFSSFCLVHQPRVALVKVVFFFIGFSCAGLSSQNHLIVTVPPFHNQLVTSPVTVGIFVMTNAGRSNEAQTFTYVPDSGTAALSKRTPILIKLSHFYCRAENIDLGCFKCSPQSIIQSLRR